MYNGWREPAPTRCPDRRQCLLSLYIAATMSVYREPARTRCPDRTAVASLPNPTGVAHVHVQRTRSSSSSPPVPPSPAYALHDGRRTPYASALSLWQRPDSTAATRTIASCVYILGTSSDAPSKPALLSMATALDGTLVWHRPASKAATPQPNRSS